MSSFWAVRPSYATEQTLQLNCGLTQNDKEGSGSKKTTTPIRKALSDTRGSPGQVANYKTGTRRVTSTAIP